MQSESDSPSPESVPEPLSSNGASRPQEPPKPIVGIGASAGGVEALQEFLEAVPADTDIAVVVVLHLGDSQESKLTEVLQRATTLPLEKAEDGTRVQGGRGYVIPAGSQLRIEGGVLRVDGSGEVPRTSTIDHFFRSLAADQGDNAVGVVLSGTGTDGTLGLRAIKEAAGATFVQAPEAATYDHMPQSAIATGLVDVTGPAPDLAEKLLEYRDNAGAIQLPDAESALGQEQLSVLEKIFSRLYTQAGHDFSGYKRSTTFRRLERRMQLRSITSLEAYLRLLRRDDEEVEALKKDLLITVTSFFRDPAAFEALQDRVFPEMVEQKDPTESVRVWVPACATGEEAYSLAILLLEQFDRPGTSPHLQVFATDVDEDAIQFARQGRYPESIEADVSAERLDRFFQPDESHYRVTPRLRERIVFAEQDLLTDPPFSNLDLVSCRNVLIYLQSEMQRRALRRVHYSLRGEGYLFLGRSETPTQQAALFSLVDEAHNLHRARTLPEEQVPVPPPSATLKQAGDDARGTDRQEPRGERMPRGKEPGEASPSEMDRLHYEALMQDVSGLLVDENKNVVHLTDRASEHLGFSERTPNLNVLDLVADELRPLLRTGLHRVFENEEPCRYPRVEVEHGADGHELEEHGSEGPGPAGLMDLSVRPLEGPEGRTYAHVRLEERPFRENGDADAEEARTSELEEELKRTREQLRTTTEEHEATTEEMEAANEELLSMNEELKSKNDELKRNKEEYQSLNEELETTNQELQAKIEELQASSSALENLMAATNIAVLFLSRDLEIRRFTPRATELFNIRPPDEGRPLSDFTHHFEHENLIEDAREVLRTHELTEREVRQGEDQWFLMRLRPYRTVEETVDGVVLTFIDISSRRQLERKLIDANERARKQIGRRLHDALSSDLAAGIMLAESVRKQVVEEGLEAGKRLEEVIEVLKEGARKARDLSRKLVPTSLQEETIARALQELCNQYHDPSGLQCDFEGDLEEELPRRQETAIHLYRIAQEALTNAQKHGEATRVEVVLGREGGALQLTVRDDGVGIPEDLRKEPRKNVYGVGLSSMQHRAHLIGGSLHIGAEEAWPTVVTCRLPLTEARRE